MSASAIWGGADSSRGDQGPCTEWSMQLVSHADMGR